MEGMQFTVLASDYDGTLATHGELRVRTVEALQRVAESGRKLVLVTGRTLDGLALICPDADIFDIIVAENGAVLHQRDAKRTTLLADPLPDDFAAVCRDHGVPEMHMGQVIASTWANFREGVEQSLAALGLKDCSLSYNKGSLMILPPGVDKATGLAFALKELGASAAATVALGDAENDLPMLSMVGCGVAVANALDAVKERADIVTTATHGEGAIEVLDALVDDDLRDMLRTATRRVASTG